MTTDQAEAVREIEALAEGLTALVERAPKTVRRLVAQMLGLAGQVDLGHHEALVRERLPPEPEAPRREQDLATMAQAIRGLYQHLQELARLAPAEASGLVVCLIEATREAQRRAAQRLQATDPVSAALLRQAAGEDTPTEERS